MCVEGVWRGWCKGRGYGSGGVWRGYGGGGVKGGGMAVAVKGGYSGGGVKGEGGLEGSSIDRFNGGRGKLG